MPATHNAVTRDELLVTMASMLKHRRPDGTYNSTKISRELGLGRYATQERIKHFELGNYDERLGKAALSQFKRGVMEADGGMSPLHEALRHTLRKGRRPLHEIQAQHGASKTAIRAAIKDLKASGIRIEEENDTFWIQAKDPQHAYVGGPATEIISAKDDTFCVGAMGDMHAASKYARWDVREDLIRVAERMCAQAIVDTGNWIDGEAPFNRYDLEAVGLSSQVNLLAERHPKTKLPIYAVTGDDHEGWYARREGMDVGWYCENRMREAGFDWHSLGYMEAHIRLTNANSGKSAILAVIHPGGGSAYAVSYRPQKIVESWESGEKPNVAFMGHYHKLSVNIIRNVWVVQTGCCQDQTPFMRGKSIDAHVGGGIIRMEQDPRTGAIIGMEAALRRYFNVGYYDASKRWSRHGRVGHPPRSTKSI